MLSAVFKRVKKIQIKTENAVSQFITNIGEMKSGVRTIKMTSQEATESKRISGSADEIRKNTFKLMRTQALTPPVIDLSSAFVYMLVIGGGGYMALSDQFDMDGAAIIAFLIGLVLVFEPARNVAQFFTQLQSSLVLLESVHSILDIEKEDFKSGEKFSNKNQAISINFENVSFAYETDKELLKNISVNFLPGTKNGIVGKTGSGKTTILSLIGRLYEIDSGTITFNGKNIANLSLASIRNQITVVSQDIVIFDQSLEDNIRYADPTASSEMVLQAAKEAKIDELLLGRKGQPVGPGGTQLSGGQRQRVALARAFLKPAPILLLDEATSSLDAVTEESIMSALDKLGKNRTTIVVAHKFSTIQQSDMIVVMDNGELVESGNHKELMEKGGQYSVMFKAQAQKNI